MSFFQSISIASQERIHSQVFSWFFSPDCKATNEHNKISLLEKIVGQGFSSEKIIKVTTEEENIDIIIYKDKAIVAFENKIKSTTHSNQLEKYDSILSKKPINQVYKIYLSLFDEDINNTNWKLITHRDVSKIFQSISYNTSSNDSVIFQDYLEFYTTLGDSAFEFLKTPSGFERVFKDGSLKKHEKSISSYASSLESFICINQLETIFQKMFYKKLAQDLGFSSQDYLIEETRGNALINLYVSDFIKEEVVYQLGVQLQRNSIKVIFQDKAYNKSSHKNLPERVVKFFKENLFFKNKSESFNPPRSKCYFSKSATFVWGSQLDELRKREISELIASLKGDITPKLNGLI
ncbi:hypothetical protein BMS_0762 [Halobacteriovorax marinus SJ]|uniref:PD-(D/E)XK nuclease superfamily protein n=1 Tax=Halobacteriovorax marinus (strain ATCC BAA-682 / DSM 15412 / SJ) TaxID=862908 RepID=E1X5U9_HALMS|nr:PD-(D/E)XK nuclease family protein [Halobacteriovorax marinus]CBW25666.1 hypothetical protein BMS_0762 [Halobacteriovorax marinus SJ]